MDAKDIFNKLPFLGKKQSADDIEGLEIRPEDIKVEDIIAPSLIEIKQNYLKLGERLCKTFFVFSYPRYLSAGWLSPVINLNYSVDVSLHIHPVNSGVVLKQLRKKLTEIQAELAEREEKGLIRDPALETAYRDIEELRDELQTARERVFRLGLYITVYGDDEKELRQTETLLRSILESRLLYLKPTLMREREGFVSTAPYGLDQIMVHTPMNTAPLSSMFPFVSPDLSANEGVLYGINMHNNSLVLFDRFTLENANSVIFAKSGSGKSVRTQEEVLVKDKNGVRISPIGPLIEDIIERQGIDFTDEELEGKTLPGLKVWTFNEQMQGQWGEVKIAARKKAPDTFYKIKTRSGRQITTTGDHNFVVLQNGQLSLTRGSAITEGDYIPLPRTVDFCEQVKEADYSDQFLRVLGYITSEGCLPYYAISLSIRNWDDFVLEDIIDFFKKEKIIYRQNIDRHEVVSPDKTFVDKLMRLGGAGKSGQKRVWPFIFGLSKEQIAQYLAAYFEGDGGVENHIEVTATSKSEKLISDISYLLYSFGIVSRMHKTKKEATNCSWKEKRVYWKLSISGQDNLKKFAKEINFLSNRKREALNSIIQKTGNTNVDIVPGVASIFREITRLFGCQLHNIQDISNLQRGHYEPSPAKLTEMIGLIESRISRFKELAANFKVLADLPCLTELIACGSSDKALNRQFWQILGQSWRVVKNEGIMPRCQNAFKMIEAGYGQSYQLPDVKQAIYDGFQEMDLMVKHYDKSLQSALVARPESNTRYDIIQQAADFVWQKYQDILNNKIPQVEAKLNQLRMLADSQLFWDPIVKVEKIVNKTDKYVYDLTCQNGVFLAGKGGMFVHNSYFCKLEVLRYLMQDVGVIIIDPENEYDFLADAVDGAYFQISLNSPHHLNPFDLPPPDEGEKGEDILRANIINLVGLLRIMLGGLSPEEDAVMDQAISATYQSKGITADSDPADWPGNIPLMVDLEKSLGQLPNTESLLARVRKFTQGTYASFFNSPSNTTLDKNLVIFGIRDMEDELRPMATFIILRYIWNQVRSSFKKRILLVDEAWWLMQSEDGASFLYGICKRARKYWLGVTTITQDVSDFLASNYGRPIITNSSIQLLMKQSSATIDVVQNTFSLTDGEKNTLLEADVGEGIFIAGQKRIALKVVASYTEDQIITSSPEQVKKIRAAKKRVSQLPQPGKVSRVTGMSGKPVDIPEEE